MNDKKKNFIIETLGWLGLVLGLSAYFLLTIGVFNGQSPEYHLMNIGACITLFFLAKHKKVAQAMIINIFWIIVAVIALVRAG